MKRLFKKIKNWFDTEKCYSRAVLILMCFAIFTSGILIDYLIDINSCTNNSSNVETVSLISNNYYEDKEYVDNIEDLEFIDVSDEEMLPPFEILDFNIDNYTNVMTYGFRPILRPEITNSQLTNIKTQIRNYAYDYYKPYDNLLYLTDNVYYFRNVAGLPVGLTFEVKDGLIHINGYSDGLAVLRIDISELFNNSFINFNYSMQLYTTLFSDDVEGDFNYFYVGLLDSNKEHLIDTKTFSDGTSYTKESIILNRIPKYLEIRVYSGIFNDVTFLPQFERTEYYNEEPRWYKNTVNMRKRAHISEKPYDVMCMYNNCVYSFNECFNSMDTYQTKLENETLNSRDTFLSMVSNVVSAPINVLKDSLNFSLFGFNIFNVLCSIATLLLVGFVLKKIL